MNEGIEEAFLNRVLSILAISRDAMRHAENLLR
jgi:hypothetical protein